MFVPKRSFILYPLILLALALAPSAIAADALAWSLAPDIYGDIDDTEFEDLRGDAFRAGVPIPLVLEAVELLFDESKPNDVPDEIIAKKRLYALTIAQERIVELRDKGEGDVPSDAEVRASAIAAVDAAGCSVEPTTGSEADEVAKEYVAPLTPDQEQEMRDYMAALDAFAEQLQASVDEVARAEPEPVEGEPEDGVIRPDPLPEKPAFVSAARASYENLDAGAKAEVRDALRKESLKRFRCEGEGCRAGNCEPDVDFETEEELVEGKPLQLKFRVVAVPRCSCGG